MDSQVAAHRRVKRLLKFPPVNARITTEQCKYSLAVAACGSLRLGLVPSEVYALSALARAEVSRTTLVQRKLLGDGGEKFPHVLARLCGCLEEKEAGFAGVLLRVGGGDGALIGRLGDKIELVAGKGDDYVLVRLALELLYPGLRLV